jgi:hypothetical protein
MSWQTWEPNTTIKACNVQWDNTYNKVPYWYTEVNNEQVFDYRAREYYFENITGSHITLDRITILKRGEPLLLPIPLSDMLDYNYLVVKQPPLEGASYGEEVYYFINNVSYIAPNTTMLNLQVDVMQTYFPKLKLGQCYVEQGHIGIANELLYKAGSNDLYEPSNSRYWREYLTHDEGLSLGRSYVTSQRMMINLLNGRANDYGTMKPWRREDGTWQHTVFDMAEYYDGISIIVASSIALESDLGTIDAPKFKTSTATDLCNIPTPLNYYSMSPMGFQNLQKYLSDFPWASQGIQFVQIVPAWFTNNFFLEGYNVGGTEMAKISGQSKKFTEAVSGDKPFYTADGSYIPISLHKYLNDDSWLGGNNKLRKLRKFWCYPYTQFLNKTTTTNSITRPEMHGWTHSGADVYSEDTIDWEVYTSIGNNSELYIRPMRYGYGFQWDNYAKYDIAWDNESEAAAYDSYMINPSISALNRNGSREGTNYSVLRMGECNDYAVRYNGFPTVATITNAAALSVASRANAINAQRELIAWNSDKAISAAEVGYQQSTGAMTTGLINQSNSLNAQRESLRLSQNAQRDNQMLQNTLNPIMGALGGAAGGANMAANMIPGGNTNPVIGGVAGGAGAVIGGMGGAIAGAVKSAVDSQMLNNSLGAAAGAMDYSQSMASQNLMNDYKQQEMVRDSNYGFAGYAAVGDRRTAIAQLNASIADSQIIAPSIQTYGSNPDITWAMGDVYFSVDIKRIEPTAMLSISNYWFRYGYKVNAYHQPRKLMCMTEATFWKMVDLNVIGECPEEHKRAIEGIFMRGVTFYRDPDNIATLDFSDQDRLLGIGINYG